MAGTIVGSVPEIVPSITEINRFARSQLDFPCDATHAVDVVRPRRPVVQPPPPGQPIFSGCVTAFKDVAHFHHAIVVGGVNMAEGMAGDFYFDWS